MPGTLCQQRAIRIDGTDYRQRSAGRQGSAKALAGRAAHGFGSGGIDQHWEVSRATAAGRSFAPYGGVRSCRVNGEQVDSVPIVGCNTIVACYATVWRSSTRSLMPSTQRRWTAG